MEFLLPGRTRIGDDGRKRGRRKEPLLGLRCYIPHHHHCLLLFGLGRQLNCSAVLELPRGREGKGRGNDFSQRGELKMFLSLFAYSLWLLLLLLGVVHGGRVDEEEGYTPSSEVILRNGRRPSSEEDERLVNEER